MLLENMAMAFSAIRANKMRSILTMLGIVIGIGSVISIVSIGDTMRNLFADLYKDVGVTQGYVQVMQWMVDDYRQSDLFTLDEMEQVREVFQEEIAYIDSSAGTSGDAVFGRKTVAFDYSGIDWNYQQVQPVTMVYGRYLNEGDILGRRTNAVMDVDSAMKLFGTENAVGKTFRTTIYGEVLDFTVVGIYRKEMSPFQKLMMGNTGDSGSAFIPYTLLTWPNDYFSMLHIYAAADVDIADFYSRLTSYVARMKNRTEDQIYTYTAQEEMDAVDQVMGGLSVAVGGIAAISLVVGGIGIMNIMLVSVTERTREIGIRKSLGAKRGTIMQQFVIEAAVTSSIGGIIGIILGAIVTQVAGNLIGITATPTPVAVIISFSVSVGIGLIFGYMPANRAAKLNPIDALRSD